MIRFPLALTIILVLAAVLLFVLAFEVWPGWDWCGENEAVAVCRRTWVTGVSGWAAVAAAIVTVVVLRGQLRQTEKAAEQSAETTAASLRAQGESLELTKKQLELQALPEKRKLIASVNAVYFPIRRIARWGDQRELLLRETRHGDICDLLRLATAIESPEMGDLLGIDEDQLGEHVHQLKDALRHIVGSFVLDAARAKAAADAASRAKSRNPALGWFAPDGREGYVIVAKPFPKGDLDRLIRKARNVVEALDRLYARYPIQPVRHMIVGSDMSDAPVLPKRYEKPTDLIV